MLVLSRQPNESILFPELGIAIEVLQFKGSRVRLGIDAPIEIKVLRGELENSFTETQRFDIGGDSEHEVRNRLNTLNVAAALAKKLIEKGEYNLAANKLHRAIVEIQSGENLEQDLEQNTCESESELSALLVEDVDNEREMLAGFLRLHGIHVASVADGQEALDFLELNRRPDFILVDIGLPRKTGSELIRELRANPSFDDTQLFAISGKSPQQARIDPIKNRIAR